MTGFKIFSCTKVVISVNQLIKKKVKKKKKFCGT